MPDLDGLAEHVECDVLIWESFIKGLEKGEVGGVDGEARFLQDLADDRVSGGFCPFQLAAGETPGAFFKAAGRAQQKQELAAALQIAACGPNRRLKPRGRDMSIQ